MSANPQTIIPAHGGINLAELSPLLKLGEGDKNTSTSLQEAFKERFQHYKSLEQSTWDEMYRSGEEVALFLQGKQYLMPNRLVPGGWVPYKISGRQNEQEKRALSVMQYHCSGNLEKWLSSNPDILITPGVESDEAYESAQAAKIIVNHYEKKFFANKARLQIEECLEGLTFGSYIWRLGFDQGLKSLTAYREIFENRTVKLGPGWGKCGDCGNEGGYEDFIHVEGEGISLCPKCHSEALVIAPATADMPSLVNRVPVEMGDFTIGLVPFSQCKWDLRVHADESSWLIIRKRTTNSAVRQILGNIRLPEGGASDVGLDITDRLAYSGQAQVGYTGSHERPTLYKEPATIEEFWMSPDEYGDIILQRQADTVSGQSIPSGVRLGERFKGKSICVLGLNEMSAILGIFVEDHRDYIVQGKWYAKKGTGAGRGLQDLTEVQKVFNSDHQKIHTYLRSVSTPSMLVASDVLGEEGKGRYIGTPGMNIPIPFHMLAEGVTMDQLVRPAFQPQSVPAQFFEFTYNRLGEFAQFASHFLPFTGGIPGVDNSTATGANITQAATDALYTPPLSVKGEVRQLIFEKLIKQYPQRFPVDREFPLGGKHSAHTGKYLVKANLCTDLTYQVVRDSWLPRNSFRKQQSYAGFFAMFGGVMGYLQARKADPERVDDVVRAFDLELESEERNVAHSLCFRRVRQMQAQANLVADPLMLVGVQMVPDPAGQPEGQFAVTGQGAIQPPISRAEPAHEVKRQWLMEWLDSDTGLTAGPVMRQAVELLIVLHTQFAGQQASMLAMQQGAVQMAGQAPIVEAQRQQQAAQFEQGLAQQEQGMEMEATRAIGEQAVRDAELEAEATKHAIKNDAMAEKIGLKMAEREHRTMVGKIQEQR
jgi:hypothetical protein